MRNIKTLKKNYEFKNVLNKGKFYKGKFITIYITQNNSYKNIIGIAISSKLFNAVKRNKIKRLIRESYRLEESNIKIGYNIVFLWNKKNEIREYSCNEIRHDMKYLFEKAKLL